jgi:hypothetical protein
MPSSWMLYRVAFVRTSVLEERIAFMIRVTRISVLRLLVAANVVYNSPNPVTLMMEAIRSSEKSVVTRTTGLNSP